MSKRRVHPILQVIKSALVRKDAVDAEEPIDEDEAAISPLDEPGYGPYLEIKLPTTFWLDDGAGEDGPFRAKDFVRDPETGVYVSSTDGHTVYLRVLAAADDDRTLTCLDGGGRLWRYRVLPE